MQTILDVIAPIFCLIAIGYAAARFRLLSLEVGEALVGFVFAIAVPTLLFRTLATVDFGEANPLVLWTAYFGGVAVTWTAGSLLVRFLVGSDWRTSVIAGVSSSFANTVFVAIPTVERAYGPEGLSALLLIIAVHLPVMMIASTLLMQRAASRDAHLSGTPVAALGLLAVLRQAGRNLSRNPLVIGIVFGLLWRAGGADLPRLLDEVTRLLGATAGPLALVALGMSLVRYGIKGEAKSSAIVIGLSLLLMPAAVYLIGADLLPPVWLKAAVLTAACPAGVNAYLLAAHFRSGEKLAANTILLSTMISVVTLGFWLAVLG